jgi:flagellar basal-body rod modification protein FlgD
MPVSSVYSTSGSGPPADMISTGNAALGKVDFLKLLVTQLSYQDPLSPMEGTEFSSQLAQFSSLEELQKMSGSLDSSFQANLLLATSINNSMATTLIGRTVRAATDTVQLTQAGDAPIHFLLDSSAADVSVEVVNQSGETVRELSASDLSAGKNTISWDGCDEAGQRLDPGSYTIRVTAKDSGGQSVGATAYLEGQVTGVLYRDGVAILLLGSQEVTLDNVLSVYDEDPQRTPIG